MADLFGHEAPPIPPGMIEITCEWRDETPDAIAIVPRDSGGLRLTNGREVWTWLPLMYVEKIRRVQNKMVTLTIPEWLAKAEHLI